MFIILIVLILGFSFIFSMLGLGGALVYNPMMVWFGYPFKEVVLPTGLLLNGLTALSAAWVFYRNKLIDFSIGIPLTIAASLGSPLGAYLSQFVPTNVLLWIFIGILLLSGGRMLLVSKAPEVEHIRGSHTQRMLIGVGVGFSVGTLAGLLGIGGGLFFVPVLLALGYPTKVVAATTTLAVTFSSFTGFAGHIAVGHFDWQLLIFAGIAVVIGSQIGSRVMNTRIKPQLIKQMFGTVLLLVAVKMIWGLL